MKEMNLSKHLDELRHRVIKIAIIIMFSFFICYGFGDPISEFLLNPLRTALASSDLGEIVYLGVLDKVISQIQVAFWTSLILSSPLWFYQIWKFVTPGLYEHERKVIRPFILVGLTLFCVGVLFGQYLVFPFVFETLMKFGVDNVKAAISIKEYLILASKILVLLGLIFQLPNILLILGFMGIVTKYNLKNKRHYIYVGLAFASALLTPPDPLTMLGLWLPLVLLFELGILGVALIVHPYLERHSQ